MDLTTETPVLSLFLALGQQGFPKHKGRDFLKNGDFAKSVASPSCSRCRQGQATVHGELYCSLQRIKTFTFTLFLF